MSLTKPQAEILTILYKFRFATRELIAGYQEVNSGVSVHYRLNKLLEEKYIARRYTGGDRIAGRPAVYYLTILGIKYLSTKPNLDPKVLNLIYKDKYASDKFIADCLSIFRLYLQYLKRYKSKIEFYTKSETHEYPYFIKPNPHAFVTFEDSKKADLFIELVSVNTPYFAIRRRINQYIKHYDSDVWQTQTGEDYPEVLMLVDDQNTERRLKKTVANLLENQGIADLAIKTKLYPVKQ